MFGDEKRIAGTLKPWQRESIVEAWAMLDRLDCDLREIDGAERYRDEVRTAIDDLLALLPEIRFGSGPIQSPSVEFRPRKRTADKTFEQAWREAESIHADLWSIRRKHDPRLATAVDFAMEV